MKISGLEKNLRWLILEGIIGRVDGFQEWGLQAQSCELLILNTAQGFMGLSRQEGKAENDQVL